MQRLARIAIARYGWCVYVAIYLLVDTSLKHGASTKHEPSCRNLWHLNKDTASIDIWLHTAIDNLAQIGGIYAAISCKFTNFSIKKMGTNCVKTCSNLAVLIANAYILPAHSYSFCSIIEINRSIWFVCFARTSDTAGSICEKFPFGDILLPTMRALDWSIEVFFLQNISPAPRNNQSKFISG